MNIASIIGPALLVLVKASGVHAAGQPASTDFRSWADQHQGTDWAGPAELWLDPTGYDANKSDATLSVEPDGLVYTWSYEGREHRGELRRDDQGLRWKDSWHQPEFVALEPVPRRGSLVAAAYSYPAGSGPDWHWGIKLSQRPDGTLVLQMTNIAPWGEEARAVRMILALVASEPADQE